MEQANTPVAGMLCKAASASQLPVTEAELTLINKQALNPLTAEEVFTFKIAACDNQIDREFERFTEDTLVGLAGLFLGKTVLQDHDWSVKKQTARIYAADVAVEGKLHQLVLRCYMLRTAGNEAMIAAIEGGIVREVSVGCTVKRCVCSICGEDKRVTYCQHRPGEEYDGQLCHVDLEEAADAYELSLVAVPAQRNAGTRKVYGGEENKREPKPDGQDAPLTTLSLRLRAAVQYAKNKKEGT
ncbi:MAG: hypothetical protein RSB55_06470 [Oscillospiraceae bacterium]